MNIFNVYVVEGIVAIINAGENEFNKSVGERSESKVNQSRVHKQE